MRPVALFSLFVLGFTNLALAATPVTIDQLEQLLIAGHSKPDAKIARQLAGLQLTERATTARLNEWESEYQGARTRGALTVLADTSAFLALPPADIPTNPPPDSDAQRRMLLLTIDYIGKTIANLPNFMATRETTHFEDTPPQLLGQPDWKATHLDPGQYTDYEPLHITGRSAIPVTYRDGHEVEQTARAKAQVHGPPIGLTTSGEFGPVLAVVVPDAFRNQMMWSHWERWANGLAAVFAYHVPQGQSHYLVEFRPGPDWVQIHPEYYGEIAIDPATGSVLRITARSKLTPPWQAVSSAILIEYGRVLLGDRTYICPVKGVALSTMPVATSTQDPAAHLKTRLNDVAFVEYHLFHADAHIVGAAEPPQPENPPSTPNR